ncbi:MAG: SAM-dependent methyltransferase [Spirochaetota bacterium]
MKENSRDRGVLYLIPTTLGDIDPNPVTVPLLKDLLNTIEIYLVENEKKARKFLHLLGIQKNINELTFHVLNKHTDPRDYDYFMESIDKGKNIGIIPNAGCPGIADPGAEIVALAHRKNIRVSPVIGASSIILSLMASGFNGQNFTFHGYLPINRKERCTKILELEKAAYLKNQTQIFMETPYRNRQLFQDIISNCRDTTKLCLAVNLSLTGEVIETRTVDEWKRENPALHKLPAVFLLYK